MSKTKETFEHLRDLFKENRGPKENIDYEGLREALYQGLKSTGTLDPDYLDHIPMYNGRGYTLFSKLIKEKLPLQDCYTALTFLVRAKNLKGAEDMFNDYVNVGDIYDALVYICKLLE